MEKQNKKTFPNWLLFVLSIAALFVGAFVSEVNEAIAGLITIPALALLASAFIRRRNAKAQAIVTAESEKQKAAEQERINAETERRAKQEEWLKENGKLEVTIKGVTFKNDDKSSRQAILKSAYQAQEIGEALKVWIEPFEYEGEPAARVLVDGRCIGNISRDDVDSVLAILNRIYQREIYVEPFKTDEGKTIYRADLTLTYHK